MNLAVLLTVALWGADARITAPETALAGAYVCASGKDAAGALSWTVSPSNVTVFTEPTGREIVIRMPPSGIVKIKQTAKDNTGTSSDVVLIEVAGTTPQPQPKDEPTTVPEGRFGIGPLARDKAADVRVSGADQRKAEALLIANRLTLLREAIEQGKIKTDDPNVVIAGIKATLKPLPADVKLRWGDWAQAWSHAVTEACNDGKILTGTDWAVFLDETVLGLKGVK